MFVSIIRRPRWGPYSVQLLKCDRDDNHVIITCDWPRLITMSVVNSRSKATAILFDGLVDTEVKWMRWNNSLLINSNHQARTNVVNIPIVIDQTGRKSAAWSGNAGPTETVDEKMSLALTDENKMSERSTFMHVKRRLFVYRENYSRRSLAFLWELENMNPICSVPFMHSVFLNLFRFNVCL